jgi:hypothetical protein
LIAGIPARLQKCLANEGKSIGHLLRNLTKEQHPEVESIQSEATMAETCFDCTDDLSVSNEGIQETNFPKPNPIETVTEMSSDEKTSVRKTAFGNSTIDNDSIPDQEPEVNDGLNQMPSEVTIKKTNSGYFPLSMVGTTVRITAIIYDIRNHISEFGNLVLILAEYSSVDSIKKSDTFRCYSNDEICGQLPRKQIITVEGVVITENEHQLFKKKTWK